MSRNTKIVLAILALGVVVVGLIGYWASARRAAQTASAVATVVSVKTAARKGEDDTIVSLSYRAGSAAASGNARVRGVHQDAYPAGKQVRICYDPANTKSLRIEDGTCG
jgi:hypothetical protein